MTIAVSVMEYVYAQLRRLEETSCVSFVLAVSFRRLQETSFVSSIRESPYAYIPLAPVAETGFRHRLTTNKIVGHFFGLSYLNILGQNQVENSFFVISNISVPCSHAQLRGRTVIKKLWSFCGPPGRDRSQSPRC